MEKKKIIEYFKRGSIICHYLAVVFQAVRVGHKMQLS